MSCATSQYQLGVRNIIMGENRKQVFCITAKKDLSGLLAGTYFVFHIPVTNVKHYVWVNVTSNASSIDPAIPNATGHEVVVASNSTAQQVATATGLVLAAISGIASATVTDKTIEVTMTENGYAYEARDAMIANKKTGFQITVTKFGSLQADAGPTQGDITLTIEQQFQEIKSPQTGDLVLGQIRRGVKVSSSFELKSTSELEIRKSLNYYGGSFVTDDADSAVITGYGTKNMFKSFDDVTIPIILREPSMAADNDPSRDLTVVKCKVALGEITYSGEAELVLPIEVTGFVDQNKFSGFNIVAYGDSTKI